MNCCDYDRSLKSIFQQINSKSDARVEFQPSDIRQLPYENNAFDVINCVSVLEHTSDFEGVIQEFKRILKPNGLLIVTFDISIDGDADIPVNKARDLIKLLQLAFSLKNDSYSEFDAEKWLNILNQNNPPILTTEHIRRVMSFLTVNDHPLSS